MARRAFVRELPWGTDAFDVLRRVYSPGERAILFDSVPHSATTAEERDVRRWSFVAWSPVRVLEVVEGEPILDGTPLDVPPLKALSRFVQESSKKAPGRLLPPFGGGAAGLFSYEALRLVERIPLPKEDPWGIPDVILGDYDRLVAIDHSSGRAELIAFSPEGLHDGLERLESDPPPLLDLGPVRLTHSPPPGSFEEKVKRAQEYILSGDVYQVNLSERFCVEGLPDPLSSYVFLRRRNPAPFSSFFDGGEFHILSSSPERLFQIDGRRIEARPIAGTRPRGRTPKEDLARREELRSSPKEMAEHTMLVDLARNDLGKVSKTGSVRVDRFAQVETYRTVHHLVSSVCSELARRKGPIDVWSALFPGGTITGVPKVRAMEIIYEIEGSRRGPYTGGIGYLSRRSSDINILIRTALYRSGRALFSAGAGIVEGSDPSHEEREVWAKARGILSSWGVPE